MLNYLVKTKTTRGEWSYLYRVFVSAVFKDEDELWVWIKTVYHICSVALHIHDSYSEFMSVGQSCGWVPAWIILCFVLAASLHFDSSESGSISAQETEVGFWLASISQLVFCCFTTFTVNDIIQRLKAELNTFKPTSVSSTQLKIKTSDKKPSTMEAHFWQNVRNLKYENLSKTTRP